MAENPLHKVLTEKIQKVLGNKVFLTSYTIEDCNNGEEIKWTKKKHRGGKGARVRRTNDRLISKTHKEIKQFVEYKGCFPPWKNKPDDVKTEPDKNKMEEPEDHRQHIKNKRIEEEGRAWLREYI